jgi:hypothetical protein
MFATALISVGTAVEKLGVESSNGGGASIVTIDEGTTAAVGAGLDVSSAGLIWSTAGAMTGASLGKSRIDSVAIFFEGLEKALARTAPIAAIAAAQPISRMNTISCI